MTGRDYLRALVLRDRNKTATTALPQRTPGTALADACSAVAGMRGIGRCEDDGGDGGRLCDWHETRRLLREGECGCCIGRYGTCRNTKGET